MALFFYRPAQPSLPHRRFLFLQTEATYRRLGRHSSSLTTFMYISPKPRFGLKGLLALYAITAMSASLHANVAWGKAQSQAPAWYSSDEAIALADCVVAYQHPTGGWPKNTDMSVPPPPKEELSKVGSEHSPTIDNGATTSQLIFLAKTIEQHPEQRWIDSFNRGLDYLFEAQYANGGWPQFFPLRKGYYTHITFNDDAMAKVMKILSAVAKGEAPYAFVDQERRAKASTAFAKGIDCILRCQIVVNGVKTVWCAQHDEVTFAPAAARRFEPISFSGKESIDLVELLMSIEKPTQDQIAAVQAAIAWYEKVKLVGVRYEKVSAPDLPGGTDKVLIEDPTATEPLWARFYEIPTMRPIFIGRDTVIHYTLSEIEHERRTGYGWYTTEARSLLAKHYPKWKKRLGL